MTPAFAVQGWCPGALRPMESGDGLVVRQSVTAMPSFSTVLAAVAPGSFRNSS